jgi:ElaB/YqjD/DUF883 family membrane-anchored ribosome-binding protein
MVMLMNTVVKHEVSLLQKAFHAGQELGKLGVDSAQIKAKIEDAVENGIKAAKRTVRNGQHATEDLLDEAKYKIKREPLGSVALSLGIGLGLGAIVGWLVTRSGRH